MIVLAVKLAITMNVSAVDAGINSIEDLRGKIVNICNHRSGNRGNAIDALENAGINWETDIQAEGQKLHKLLRCFRMEELMLISIL